MPLTPAERRLRARIAAHALHAKVDGREHTARATAARLARFETEVDPDGVLPPEERRRRAISARKAHMARLALKASKARRERRGSPPPQLETEAS